MEYPQEYSRSQSAQAMDIPKDQRIHKDFIRLSRKSLIFAQGPTDTLAYSCYAPERQKCSIRSISLRNLPVFAIIDIHYC